MWKIGKRVTKKETLVCATKVRLIVRRPTLDFFAQFDSNMSFRALKIVGDAAAAVQRIERDWYYHGGALHKNVANAAVLDGGTYEIDFATCYLNLAAFGTGRCVSQAAEYFHAHRIPDGALLDVVFANDPPQPKKFGPLVFWPHQV